MNTIRPALKRARNVCLLLLAVCSAGLLAPLAHAAEEMLPKSIRVAVVQMRSERDLAANVATIRKHLAESAQKGVQVVAFPECALTTYYAEFAKTLDGVAIEAAIAQVAAACREHSINAIVGTATKPDGSFVNTALFINSRGEIVARHNKVHLVGGDTAWGCNSGSTVAPVVYFDGVPCSVFICHDSRYPELTRLPVLAGARVMFYISHEAAPVKETKMVPYRAQIMARAVENGVFIAHSNAPADDWRTGSHGQSRLVAPDGNIIQEASVANEEVLIADLALADADAENATRSLDIEPLGSWWREAVAQVRVIK
jgi:predicted amidohydrolase